MRQILLMLPGARQAGEAFVVHGLVAAAQRRAPWLEVWIADLGMEAYLEGAPVGRLHGPALAEALAQGARLWLAGVSLGGLGAVDYARAHPQAVQGVLLVAPFLATRGAVAAARAGGVVGGLAGATAAERATLGWLMAARAGGPAIYAGYGLEDRYASAGRLLARHLPPGRVVAAQGGHDWPTWQVLWGRLLAIADLRVVHTLGR